MGRTPTKASSNVYCQARLEAAKYSPVFASRESAANELNISKDSLTDYELDLCKVVPVDKVIIMADAYNASYLLNNYCSNECPIGKRIVQPVDIQNINNIYRFAITATNDLEESNKIQKTLLRIVEDGVIDESEKEDLDHIIEFFKRLEKRASELRILAEKHADV